MYECDLNLQNFSRDKVVECVNIGKHFEIGSHQQRVFHELSLDIYSGTIFSLLGASGCGKTTLIKCIAGRLLVDHGVLKVFGGQPTPSHRVGYMPQMISLLDDLTVRETLWLFGRLGRMDAKRTRTRTEFMLGILGMSSHINMPFKTLSGGQQRRVAFAAALLNEAPLLILDEPTVGVDPILRQNIWTYLRSVVSRTNATVIITTHYIEEARNSEMVGMLLDGRLLAVSSPETLICTYNCSTLEDVFLKLSLEDAVRHGFKTDSHELVRRSRGMKLFPNCCRLVTKAVRRFNKMYQESFDDIRFLELTKTNLLCYTRHPWIFLCVMCLPAFIFYLVPLALGGQLSNLSLAVINEDSGNLAQKYTDSISSKIFNIIYMKNYQEGMDCIHYGSISGVIWFKRNFSTALKQRMTFPMFVSDEVITESTIYASVDYSNPPFAAAVAQELNKAFLEFGRKAAEEFSLSPNLGKLPIEISKGSELSMVNFLAFFQPAFWISMNYFLVSAALILINVSLLESGYYDRLYTAGVSALEIITSQMAYQLLMAMPQLLLVFYVLFSINGLECHGSYLLVALLVIANYLSGIFLGLAIGGVSNSLQMAVALFTFVIILTLLTQGIFWPVEGAEESVRWLFQLGPFAYPSSAIRNVINKGWTFTHPNVLRGFCVSIAWTVICFFFSWIAFWCRK